MLEHDLEQPVEQLLQGEIMVNISGTTGISVVTPSWRTVVSAKGAHRISFTTRSCSQVRQRLNVCTAEQRLVGRRPATHPFALRLPHVALRQHAVLAHSLAA